MLVQCWPTTCDADAASNQGRIQDLQKEGAQWLSGAHCQDFCGQFRGLFKEFGVGVRPLRPPLDPRLQTSTCSTPRVCWELHSTQYTQNICTMLVQRRRRCADIVGGLQMFYVCWKKQLVWYCLQLTAGCDYNPTPTQWLFASAGQYPFCPSQYFILPVPACWRYSTGTMLSTKAGLMLACRL